MLLSQDKRCKVLTKTISILVIQSFLFANAGFAVDTTLAPKPNGKMQMASALMAEERFADGSKVNPAEWRYGINEDGTTDYNTLVDTRAREKGLILLAIRDPKSRYFIIQGGGMRGEDAAGADEEALRHLTNEQAASLKKIVQEGIQEGKDILTIFENLFIALNTLNPNAIINSALLHQRRMVLMPEDTSPILISGWEKVSQQFQILVSLTPEETKIVDSLKGAISKVGKPGRELRMLASAASGYFQEYFRFVHFDKDIRTGGGLTPSISRIALQLGMDEANKKLNNPRRFLAVSLIEAGFNTEQAAFEKFKRLWAVYFSTVVSEDEAAKVREEIRDAIAKSCESAGEREAGLTTSGVGNLCSPRKTLVIEFLKFVLCL